MPWRLKDPNYQARSLRELTGICRGLSAQLDQVQAELRGLERTLSDVITQDQIEAGVKAGLQNADTRGWTWRERWIGVGAFVLLLVNTTLAVWHH